MMTKVELAWRGFVCHDGSVIAWPTYMADHNDFHRTFGTSDKDFAARWRQWSEGAQVDFDPGAVPSARETVDYWLANP